MTMTDEEIIDARQRGWSIADIISEGAAEKRVYAVLREAGLCRDQRPAKLYTVTMLTPETIQVAAPSEAMARKLARDQFDDDRVQVADIKEVTA